MPRQLGRNASPTVPITSAAQAAGLLLCLCRKCHDADVKSAWSGLLDPYSDTSD